MVSCIFPHPKTGELHQNYVLKLLCSISFGFFCIEVLEYNCDK